MSTISPTRLNSPISSHRSSCEAAAEKLGSADPKTFRMHPIRPRAMQGPLKSRQLRRTYDEWGTWTATVLLAISSRNGNSPAYSPSIW
jgi:hypothetical protein